MGFGQRQTQARTPPHPAAPLTTAALAKLHYTLGRNTAPGVGAAGARDREGVRRLGRRLPWLSGHPASPRLCAHAVPSAHGSLLAPARLSLNATLTSFGPHVLCHRRPALAGPRPLLSLFPLF